MKFTYETIHNARAEAIKARAIAAGAKVTRVPVRRDPTYCNLTVKFDQPSMADNMMKMRDFQRRLKEAGI